jgi:hypothetical protein
VIEETMFTFEGFELVWRTILALLHSFRAVTHWTPEIRKRGHHAVAVDLPGPLQRVHIARRDETRRQLAAPASGPC